MNIIKCIHTDSSCYKKHKKASPVGIVIHSTGCNQVKVGRYAQPSPSDENYGKLIEKIGKNTRRNHWNRAVSKAVHYMIGKISDGNVAAIQTLPEDICCWGVGAGKKGSYNYNPTAHIQFEVCEDDLKDETYFSKVYDMSVELCADICKRYGWGSDVIVSHKEAYKLGYASNHGDIDHWLKKFKKTMNDFRADVDAVLKPKEEYITYTVAKGDSLWKIAKKNLGSGWKYTEIMKLNNLHSIKIFPGDVLRIKAK